MIIAVIKGLLRPIKHAILGKPAMFPTPVTGVVHVGANSGQEREAYRDLGLHVLWVEPIPEVFAQLVANIRGIRNQRAVQALVTDRDGQECDFHVANNQGASSSLLDFDEHRKIWPDVAYVETLRLTSTTLATLFERERIDPSRYQALVVDTQGSELLVLRGSLPILSAFTYIMVEAADFESYAGCCQLPDIEAFMADHGYVEIRRTNVAARADVGNYFEILYKKRAA
jgi:FkbM family methyltransferase